MTIIRAILSSLLLCCAAHCAAASYALDHTEVRDVHAAALKRDYQLFVALPDSYAKSDRSYPVLFLVDADYSFPLVRSIAQRLHKHSGMEEVIVVGLSYGIGDAPVFSRRRDYTPSVPRNQSKQSYKSDMPGRPPAFGEADASGRFLTSEVFALVQKNYRADMRRKIFVGHSYGSLLGLQVMLTNPEAFQHYILGSPSLWFDRGIMFDREKAYAAAHKDLPASVYFGIGGKEVLAAGKARSRSEEDADMVADLREFDRALQSRRYPKLTSQVEVFAGEDHASVFPFMLTHGLRAWLRTQK